MKTERRHDIDWLRVLAIGLLLIYHVAIVFQPWAMFVGFVRSNIPLENLWKPMTLLNVWRIPLLFYVSGMGLYFAMRKRNYLQLLGERTRRILIPLIFGVLAIAPLHFVIFQKFYNLPISYYPHMGHLWFLGNIFIYVLVLTPLFIYLTKKEESKFKKGLSLLMKNPIGPLSLSVFFILEAVIIKPQIFSVYAETWHGFFLGLLAFFFGFLFVYSGQVFWQTISKWKWLYIGLALVLYIVRLLVYKTTSPNYLMAIESNCWIFGIFGLGYQYLNKPSAALSYLSQAAYPVYIIHMFALYAGSLIILPLDIPAMTKFVAITAFTFASCFITYEFLIRRIGFMRPLFGLKTNFKKVGVLQLQNEKL
ncbi:acyltransferase family protein [Draconibacterium sp. IB214405]|uniref:acyltransferase family protein n=1 Tax=Draconibacterium sp. IB214405 TaxID=3097352 RepID=UPI002A1702E3|nr:acyltransferase family protein [Draconibacterium sp. IB214405]MDX8340020.1 acyltransferase family protein [Draconibacterium sp. IB214405]